MGRKIKKILIANRGEIAVRIIRTCREMGIKTVAIYSQADKEALHVKLADESICIGPPEPKKSYLNMSAIISAAQLTGADAIHPGYGFLAENELFANACEKNSIMFIGPPAQAIEKLGNKSFARESAKKIGIPVVPGSNSSVKDIKEAREVIKKIGYPIILKAAAGGGGKGMRIVYSDKELETQWQTCKAEAKNAFGDDSLYIEKFIEKPRHIEIQIIGDKYGNIICFAERDCSIQRRHQKLIEETPSPAVRKKIRKKLIEAARKICKAFKYYSAGTIEFIMDQDENFYFMEMNTRIQVEHPITESIFDVDLIEYQILVAEGEKFKDANYIYPEKHAIECRINAEDPKRNFAPTPGKINTLIMPGGPGIRVDTHIYAGYEIPIFYDSLLAKIIAYGKDRPEALTKMKRALKETVIEGPGIAITSELYLKILEDNDFINGNYSTNFLSKFGY